MKFTNVLGLAVAAAIIAPVAAGAAEPPAAFNACKACHKTEAGKNGIGPSLFGVVGRKAGSLEGFNYSPAMKNAGWVWDVAKLTQYIGDPKAVVPGNKMPFAGLKKPEDAKAVAEYLATLK
ncbi:MAG: c-type cytochrome [Magnetospirillum sp.]|nr:c-type cytochrome [Magnetospirillum sp.]